MQTTSAQDTPPNELIQPQVCSSLKTVPPKLKGICEVTPLAKKGAQTPKKVKVHLRAQTSEIDVGGFIRPRGSEVVLGGYSVITENYNGAYLSPVVAAKSGDTVAARLVNVLAPRQPIGVGPENLHENGVSPGIAHQHEEANPTNLHYFHGGIVTPNNARPKPAEEGDGDNVYVKLKNGFFKDDKGKQRPHSFEYNVPIPGPGEDGKGELDAGVLEGEVDARISHPDGLGWYHSHMHGRSSDQLMGGLSGLLSVGEDTANVRAKCATKSLTPKCDRDTEQLRKKTIVRYALLRDISLREISALPEEVSETKTARWAPEDRDFSEECVVWKKNGSQLSKDTNERLRKGFCQREDDARSAWLFTLNGQRFPTITVDANRNLLLRLGNLSANVAYWLELYKEGTEEPIKPIKLSILSVDGVVPAEPAFPGNEGAIDVMEVDDLLLMPASRAEIYVTNDNTQNVDQVYILRTKKLNAGTDVWPEIQLARVVLKPSPGATKIALARNAPTQQVPVTFFAEALAREAQKPGDCVRDLEKGEFRRVEFREGGETTHEVKIKTRFSVLTEIRMHPNNRSKKVSVDEFLPDKKETVGIETPDGWAPIPFEEYVKPEDGTINWEKRHVCIRLDRAKDSPSRKQLWVLDNQTQSLHNFHIHQMKFRLAKKKELEDDYGIGIDPVTEPPSTCPNKNCDEPDYKSYELEPGNSASYPLWHDTIPVPIGRKVYLIMSYTAREQIGRFVFHCHILKHEDSGLMAPIEVWARFPGEFDR